MLAAAAPVKDRNMYEPVTAADAPTNCCGNVLTTIGLAMLNPDDASRIAAGPTPQITFAGPSATPPNR